MRDYLIDIVKHIVPLGAFQTLRIDGSDDLTEISATQPGDKEIVVRGRMHAAIPEFKGLFGIPNLPQLNTIINIPEYQDEKAKFTVIRENKDGEQVPSFLHLENASGDFKNDFRLMASRIIDGMEPKLTFKVKTWPVEFVPTAASQMRLKFQSQANPDEKVVTFTIDGGNITAHLGSVAAHSGSFVFQTGVDASVKKSIPAPVHHINSVLALTGDKTIHMGDLGMMITVDSGLATYDYIIPMLSK